MITRGFPRTPLDAWSFALQDVHENELATWRWKEERYAGD